MVQYSWEFKGNNDYHLSMDIQERPISDKTLTQRTNYLGVWDLVLTVKRLWQVLERNFKIVRVINLL